MTEDRPYEEVEQGSPAHCYDVAGHDVLVAPDAR